jgi:hypothetical protein
MTHRPHPKAPGTPAGITEPMIRHGGVMDPARSHLTNGN